MGYDHDNKMIIIEQRNYFKPLDKVNIFCPGGDEYTFIIDKIYDEDLNLLECARHPRQIIKIPFEKELKINSMIRVIF